MMILSSTPQFGNTPGFGNTPTHAQRLGGAGGMGMAMGRGGPGGEARDDDDDSSDDEHLMPMGMSPDLGMRPGELAGLMHPVRSRPGGGGSAGVCWGAGYVVMGCVLLFWGLGLGL